MTPKQKAQRYDEALERARIWQNHLYDTNDRDYADELNYIFPELKESGDEKARKAILTGLIDCRDAPDLGWSDFGGINIDECIAWLEKQDNKSVNIDIESMVNSYKQRLKSQAGIKMENNPLVNMSLIAFRRGVENTLEELNLKKLEKQGEQNLIVADSPQLSEHKPKFKVGDWVVFTNGNVEHIVSVGTHGYTFGDGDYLLHDKCDKDAHLWSIQDTKEGDVLVDVYGNIGIFEKRYGINWHTYCYLRNEGRFISEGGSHGSICYPATKSQRGALMKAMTDAGYSFDFEKKELKELGQSEVTKTSDQEKYSIPSLKDFQEAFELKARQYDIELPNRGYDIHAMCKELYSFLIKQKPAWSEDDEHRVKDAIYFLDTAKKHYASTVELDACIDWLKSIKQRIGG